MARSETTGVGLALSLGRITRARHACSSNHRNITTRRSSSPPHRISCGSSRRSLWRIPGARLASAPRRHLFVDPPASRSRRHPAALARWSRNCDDLRRGSGVPTDASGLPGRKLPRRHRSRTADRAARGDRHAEVMPGDGCGSGRPARTADRPRRPTARARSAHAARSKRWPIVFARS